jgi:hypothetical protein
MARNDNSAPSKGKNTKLDPSPSAAARPIPHAAHPGANSPRNIPAEEMNPSLLDLLPDKLLNL